MISRRYKCIFIEVPKTGSTSIRAVLGKPSKPHLDIREVRTKLSSEFPWDLNIPGRRYICSAYRFSLPGTLKQQIGERVFETYFKFGFVRNPWARVVSLYHRAEGIRMQEKMTFTEFVEWITLSSDTCIHPSPKKNQLDWFTDETGEIQTDFIGKFETLARDWETVAKRIGASPILPHRRQSKKQRPHYSTFYTPRTRQIIGEKFAPDIAYFGYTFESS